MRDDDRPGEPDMAEIAWAAAGCLAVGAGIMYLMDPRRGARRRGVVRDRAVSTLGVARTGLARTAQYVRDQSMGLAAETRARLAGTAPVDDRTLCARVRSALGRAVSHPRAVHVAAAEGAITLSGNVLADELDDLLASVGRVRGVREVRNELMAHPEPGMHPDLQGQRTRRARTPLTQDTWSPTTRLFAGAAGAAMGLYGLLRRDWIGSGLGLLGMGLAARGATNLPARRLFGVGAGRRAVDVQKTININAPADLVFGFFSNYEGFPMFMSNVRHVEDFGDGRSHWTVAGPAGIRVAWDAVLTDYVPHELIAWRSERGSIVENEGIIRVDENPDGSTRVDIRLSYNPPGGAVGHAVAALFGSDPKSEMDADLARVKNMLETGKPPRDAAQPLEVAG